MRHNFLTIFFKEFKEVLRERKTMIFMLAIPTLMMPLILEMTTRIMQKADKKARTETLAFAISGDEYLPELRQAFQADSGFKLTPDIERDSFTEAINNGDIKLGLAIPENASEMIAAGEQVEIELFYNNASRSKVQERASAVIQDFSDAERDRQLKGLGVGLMAREALLVPLTIREQGTANMREVVGERVGGMLPYFFILFCFMGALYPAIDLGAGEKERQTLETLLLTPVPRKHLVLGKFMVIFSTGVISALLSITSLGVWLSTKGKEVSGVIGEIIASVGVLDLVLIGAMLIPVAAMFAAILLSISIYAKTFKEGQAYATPMNFAVILPTMLALLPGIELNWTWAMVPLTNISLAVKELAKGTIDYTMLLVIYGSTTILAGALLVFCTKWFQREDVLFRN